MTGSPRRGVGWSDVAILLVSMVLAVAVVGWADRAFLVVEGPIAGLRSGPSYWPDWVRALDRPYRRLQHDYFWLVAVLSLGIGAIVFRDRRSWSRRGRSRPGTIVVAVTLVVGVVSVAHFLLARPKFAQNLSLSYDLLNLLEWRIPGAILGAWVVLWLGSKPKRRPEWRDRLGHVVGWLWIGNIGLLIAHGVLFG